MTAFAVDAVTAHFRKSPRERSRGMDHYIINGVNLHTKSSAELEKMVEGWEMMFREFFGVSGELEAKDISRAGSMVIQHGRNGTEALTHTVLMASKITKPDKAFRRGKAFREAGSVWWPVFFLRCKELLSA